MQSKKLLSYLQQSVDALLEQNSFDNDFLFRNTQKQALDAYRDFLYDDRLTIGKRLQGFFEIATALGKTAIFSAIVGKAHQIAGQNGDNLTTIIVVPTKPLLRQTVKDFEKFVPAMAGQVGQYGAGSKDLSQPVTVMTVNAWDELSLSGEISSDNVDVLITDESHKATSYRKVSIIDEFYDARTVRLAFTATAHFDTVKSVLQSHKREIFTKTLRDAMLEGAEELTSYIQRQAVVIRVPPTEYMRSAEFTKLPLREKVAYLKALKHDAWNNFALELWKHGKDERTGDFLSDNQTEFFVDGIQQADKLEKLLNSDPELRERSLGQGQKTVSSAIHSKLPSYDEVESRLQDFFDGAAMGTVSDEMLKEGIDHAPIKTIIDYSHGSIVDKAQILGRGTRDWWNEAKGRYEGLTFVDTIIYIGSDDPKFDKILENRAKRAAVSLKQIIGDEFLLNEGKPLSKPSPSGPPEPEIFIDNPDITYYTKVEELYELDNEIEKLRRDFVLTMEDVIETIDMYRELNDGANPFKSAGMIDVGPLEGLMTWMTLNKALKEGLYGLSNDPAWQKMSAKWSSNQNPFNPS